MTLINTKETVLSLVDQEVKGKALDIPAGKGDVSLKLKQKGYQVYAGDLNEEIFEMRDINFTKLNMDEGLPYADKSFDLIVCIEGIEHIENPHHLIREFKRILKTNGRLILTTPNILNIRSRLKFLTLGFFFWFSPLTHGCGSIKHKLNLHINPIPLWELEFILTSNGFKIEKITTSNIDRVSFLPFLLVKFFSKIAKKYYTPQILTKEVLLGYNLIVKARRWEIN